MYQKTIGKLSERKIIGLEGILGVSITMLKKYALALMTHTSNIPIISFQKKYLESFRLDIDPNKEPLPGARGGGRHHHFEKVG